MSGRGSGALSQTFEKLIAGNAFSMQFRRFLVTLKEWIIQRKRQGELDSDPKMNQTERWLPVHSPPKSTILSEQKTARPVIYRHKSTCVPDKSSLVRKRQTFWGDTFGEGARPPASCAYATFKLVRPPVNNRSFTECKWPTPAMFSQFVMVTSDLLTPK